MSDRTRDRKGRDAGDRSRNHKSGGGAKPPQQNYNDTKEASEQMEKIRDIEKRMKDIQKQLVSRVM